MVSEKLAEEAEVIRSEGWKWVGVDTDFPYGHTFGMRRIRGEVEPMSAKRRSKRSRKTWWKGT